MNAVPCCPKCRWHLVFRLGADGRWQAFCPNVSPVDGEPGCRYGGKVVVEAEAMWRGAVVS